MDEHYPAAEITLTITGTPAPQGSKKAMPIYKGSKKKGTRQFTGKVNLVEQTRKTLKPWREAVTEQAAEQYTRPAPLDVPLSVGMVFLIARPKSVRRPYPAVTPDLSKLVRAVEDALTDAGVWRDDALVVRYHELAKVYLHPDMAVDEPGVLISIRPLAAVSLPGRVASRQGQPNPRDLETLRKAALGAVEPFSA
jgi:Holliday junction resolvase RusA-like endonuclease